MPRQRSWLGGILDRIRPPKPPPPPPPTGLGSDMVAACNEARAAAGLPPLTPDARLQAAAEEHAHAMAASGVLSHADFQGRLDRSGYPYTAAAENVAAGQATAEAAVDSWMGSPAHRANLLGDYQDMGGSGARAADGTWYWCAIFGRQA